MNDIQIFKNTAFGELEVVQEDDKFWFPAIRCAEILGYQNPRDAVARHCQVDGVVKRDVVSLTVNQYGVETEQVVERKYITEGNLYRLIVSSRLETARKFEKWIFDEVLPEIRRTGGYNAKKSSFEVASLISKCPTSRLDLVIDILRRGGYDVPELKAAKEGIDLPEPREMRDLSEKIQRVMDKFGLNLFTIASLVGEHHVTMSRYYRRVSYPRPEKYKKIAEKLDDIYENGLDAQ